MGSYNINTGLYNVICEALGCFARATKNVEVRAGAQKVITLSVCNDCATKFEEDETREDLRLR